MSETDASPPAPTELLRVEVTVPLDAGGAFELFTGAMATWWPAGSSLRALDAPGDAVASLDAVDGGAWVERHAGGEVVLGEVATWDPPRLVALTWRPHGEVAGRVEVRTAPVDDDLTTVIVEHHLSGAAATDGSRRHLAGERGWWSVLRAYATAAR
jgi:uncharacterized protein YndB with AHSA1/START domain